MRGAVTPCREEGNTASGGSYRKFHDAAACGEFANEFPERCTGQLLAVPFEEGIEATVGGGALMQGIVRPIMPVNDARRWRQTGGDIGPRESVRGSEGTGKVRAAATVVFQRRAGREAEGFGKRRC